MEIFGEELAASSSSASTATGPSQVASRIESWSLVPGRDSLIMVGESLVNCLTGERRHLGEGWSLSFSSSGAGQLKHGDQKPVWAQSKLKFFVEERIDGLRRVRWKEKAGDPPQQMQLTCFVQRHHVYSLSLHLLPSQIDFDVAFFEMPSAGSQFFWSLASLSRNCGKVGVEVSKWGSKQLDRWAPFINRMLPDGHIKAPIHKTGHAGPSTEEEVLVFKSFSTYAMLVIVSRGALALKKQGRFGSEDGGLTFDCAHRMATAFLIDVLSRATEQRTCGIQIYGPDAAWFPPHEPQGTKLCVIQLRKGMCDISDFWNHPQFEPLRTAVSPPLGSNESALRLLQAAWSVPICGNVFPNP
jgi:hypothetical protein